MSFKLSTALVLVAIAVSACGQQQEEPTILEIIAEPTSSKLG